MNAQKLFSKKWIVFATAVLCTLLWGSAFPCIKTGYRMFRIASQDTADQLMFAGARFLIAGILIGGFIYRKVTHQPFKGDIPPVGVMNDLPSSVTGMNKHSGKLQ